MKPIILISGFLLFGKASWAAVDDYQKSLDRLRRNEAQIQNQFKALGFADIIGGSTGGAESRSSEKDGKRPLFQVHDRGEALRSPAGKLLFGEVHTRLVVGPEASPVVVQLKETQGLFSGLRVLGRARQSSTQGRVALEFDRVVTRSGKVISIKGLALDEQGAQGLTAQVFSSKALAVAGAMASSFISGLASSQQTQTPTAFGFSQVQPTGRNGVLQGVAQAAGDQSRRLVEEATQEKPVLVVESGSPVIVYLDEEVRF